MFALDFNRRRIDKTPTAMVVGVILLAIGCDPVITKFPPDRLHAAVLARSRDVDRDSMREASRDVAGLIEEHFGTPQLPRWPADVADERLQIDEENLRRAAGPVLQLKDNTHLGLYREHCVTCHGVDGGGNGPAMATQNPYPRNFHPGIFKWKSTARAAAPVRDDLLRTLHRGIAGTGMPSFARIVDADREALVDYTIYLSVRGEVQRQLLDAAVDEFDYGGDAAVRLVSTTPGEASEVRSLVRDVVADVTGHWADAGDAVVSVPDGLFDPPPTGDDLRAALMRGKALFHGQIANCVGCHGPGGGGEVPTLDYDDWTRHYTTQIGLNPQDRDAVRPMRAAGAPRPRLAAPRDLTDGVFRGGGDPETLYRRLTQGIAGTPMPGIKVIDHPDGTGLTPRDVADLVWYVRGLGDNQ